MVIIAPDRAAPLPGRENAWCLTARQLDSLTEKPIEEEPVRQNSDTDPTSFPLRFASRLFKGSAA